MTEQEKKIEELIDGYNKLATWANKYNAHLRIAKEYSDWNVKISNGINNAFKKQGYNLIDRTIEGKFRKEKQTLPFKTIKK